MVFSNIQKWWHDNGIWVIIFGSIFLIILFWIIRYFYSDEFDDNIPVLDYLFGGRTKKPIKKRKVIKESKGEKICREVVEKIFNKPFTKVRINILKNNKTGKNLELDIYNEELKLAVEYNGRQHYEYSKYFHRDYQAFIDQKYRDDLKRELCKKNNITLIEVPYTIKHDDIENFLRNKLNQLNIF
jgi:hypothetical protein